MCRNDPVCVYHENASQLSRRLELALLRFHSLSLSVARTPSEAAVSSPTMVTWLYYAKSSHLSLAVFNFQKGTSDKMTLYNKFLSMKLSSRTQVSHRTFVVLTFCHGLWLPVIVKHRKDRDMWQKWRVLKKMCRKETSFRISLTLVSSNNHWNPRKLHDQLRVTLTHTPALPIHNGRNYLFFANSQHLLEIFHLL